MDMVVVDRFYWFLDELVGTPTGINAIAGG